MVRICKFGSQSWNVREGGGGGGGGWGGGGWGVGGWGWWVGWLVVKFRFDQYISKEVKDCGESSKLNELRNG